MLVDREGSQLRVMDSITLSTAGLATHRRHPATSPCGHIIYYYLLIYFEIYCTFHLLVFYEILLHKLMRQGRSRIIHTSSTWSRRWKTNRLAKQELLSHIISVTISAPRPLQSISSTETSKSPACTCPDKAEVSFTASTTGVSSWLEFLIFKPSFPAGATTLYIVSFEVTSSVDETSSKELTGLITSSSTMLSFVLSSSCFM